MKATIEEVVRHLKNGGLAVVSDDENRENEGDLIGLGTKMSPENVNFMITQARGLLCVPVSKDIAEHLHLTQMVGNNTESNGTKFTYSIDGAFEVTGVTTGISAFDRSATIQKITEKDASMNDFVQPGHIFPLVAENGGVLARGGHTEAAVDLAILAGEPKVGAICEIIMPNGQMARMDYLEKFANHFELPLITIEQLADYLKNHAREEIIDQSVSYK
jgi:3,4-dihydroxy-2-butanone 4-phosphate synthase